MLPASTPKISPGELRLDPGPQARRGSTMNWKCIVLSFVTPGFLLGLYLVFKVFKLTFMPQTEGPWTNLYQDLTVPYTSGEVVQPLVDNMQTFDVVATVWLRQDMPKTPADEGGPILSEKAIYSDTIFRGMRLEDKNVTIAVELKIPTEIFKSPELWTYDLRASFVLVPDSPSPLEYTVNYSSWIPSGVNYPPMRSWPAGYLPSLADRIIDSYGTFLPLLALNHVNSSCPSASENKTEDSGDNINNDSDEIFDLGGPTQQTRRNIHPAWLYTSTRRASVFEAHPHIISRSHLRVVYMTRVFNRTEYERYHRALRDSSKYEVNQNSETRIKLRKRDPVSGKNMTEWAYAPYMSLSRTVWGPLDLVKVPVNREECQNTTSENSSDSRTRDINEDFINITWKVSFSGTTPRNLLWDDSMGSVPSAFVNKGPKLDTDEEKKNVQDNVEFISGLTGHRTNEDAHPRRQLALVGLYYVISFLEALLEMYYWFSRASTVGISIVGSLLIGGASLLLIVVQTVMQLRKSSSSVFLWVLHILVDRLPYALTPLFMIKAALRLELKWYARWIPTLRVAPPTHSERTSQRVEARISWMYQAMAFATIAFIFTYYPDVRFLSSKDAGPVGGTKGIANLISRLQALLILPSIILGRTLQLAFNHRTKRFGGMYRLCAPMRLIFMLFAVGNAIPHVVGSGAKGVSVSMIFNIAYAAILTWQAVLYAPVASQEDENSK